MQARQLYKLGVIWAIESYKLEIIGARNSWELGTHKS